MLGQQIPTALAMAMDVVNEEIIFFNSPWTSSKLIINQIFIATTTCTLCHGRHERYDFSQPEEEEEEKEQNKGAEFYVE